MKHCFHSSLLIFGIILGGAARSLTAGELTAFDLVKEGDKYIGEQARDKVIQIRSEKSVGSLVPDIWYVVYYDPTATLKATEVKFGGGKMMEVKRPLRLLEPVTGGDQTLERKKLKVDSNKALAIALKEPLLQKLDLKATQFWLEHAPGGPVWRIRFWAAKLNNPNHMADIGQLVLSTKTGEIVKNKLHPNSVD